MKKKILVTGACGFIGSHLVEKLAKKNKYDVTALCYYNSSNSIGNLSYIHKKLLKKIKIIFGDVRSEDLTTNITKNKDIVVHLAALISIPYSYVSPKSYIDTNIYGTYNILNSCKNNSVKKIIITSTSEVYGTAQYVPIDEKHPLNSQSPYAASKVAADQIALSFKKSFNLPVLVARPFNTFGPRQSSRAIIPTLITQMINQKNFIKVGNINTKRDFTYIDDTINGFIKLINSKKIDADQINIASGFEIEIKNLIKVISNQLDIKKLRIIFDKKRIRPKNSEVYRLLASNKKIKKLYNWQPKYKNARNFSYAISKTIDWFKLNKNVSISNFHDYNI
tara:strand:+ start:1921 stop:2928 length:1008 start_codon:yes stop_codon:yes gene_type:complete